LHSGALLSTQETQEGESSSKVAERGTPVPPVNASLKQLPAELEEVIYRAPSTPEQLQMLEAHQQALIKLVTPCVVGLQVGDAQGSGVIVSPDGLILTAAHVVQRPGQRMRVFFSDGKVARGITLGMDRSADAGMAKITGNTDDPQATDGVTYPYVTVGDSDALRIGEWVIAIGHHGGYRPDRAPPVRIGRVLAKSDDVITTDSLLVGGDSGGPLFNMRGEVVGIHSRIGFSLSANMHVPARSFQSSWDRLVKGEIWGEVPRGSPYIGVRGDPDSTEARIAQVEPNQPADRAGIKVGDVIVRFDGQEVKTFSDLVGMVAEREPGEKVKIVVRRGEELIELELVIGRRR